MFVRSSLIAASLNWRVFRISPGHQDQNGLPVLTFYDSRFEFSNRIRQRNPNMLQWRIEAGVPQAKDRIG